MIAKTKISLFAILLVSQMGKGQEPTVSKDSIAVHTVQRGDMPLLEKAAGSISSLQPPKAVIELSDFSSEPCKIGENASAQLKLSKILSGKIIKASNNKCEIQFAEELPVGSTIGQKLGALVEVGKLHNVVFFARPAESYPNSDATVFVVDPKNSYAQQVRVHYGQLSGPLIQVASGLSPGDRVIVTDTSKWASSSRIRLQ